MRILACLVKRKGDQGSHETDDWNNEIKIVNSIKLLATNIDNQLKFNEHITI